jgi:hypothetical protein
VYQPREAAGTLLAERVRRICDRKNQTCSDPALRGIAATVSVIFGIMLGVRAVFTRIDATLDPDDGTGKKFVAKMLMDWREGCAPGRQVHEFAAIR